MMQNESQQEYKSSDIVIVGGGIVGMAAAIALSQLKLKIVLIENFEPVDNTHQSYDDRTLVVNQASINFWSNIGVWKELKNDVTPIKSVHVSNKGNFGSCLFSASEFNLDQLASIVESKKLGFCLRDKVVNSDTIDLICPANVTNFQSNGNTINITYQQNNQSHTIESKLMLAADGIRSHIRKTLKLETNVSSYDRTAIVCNVTPENNHNFQAFERLTSTGPTALLPFVNNRCGLVWSVPNKIANTILAKSDNEFLGLAQKQFGYRLGRFIKVGKRSTYPLYLVEVPKQVKQRVILIGNAAHGMSPVSAQGLNLAVRDLSRLVDVINLAIKKQIDIGSDKVLAQYQSSIEEDQNQTMNYTDDLMNWFKLDYPIINTIRSSSLIFIDKIKPMKEELFKKASGFRGDIPSLLRRNNE
jgi:2-octaprenyl-6-methoxyphenol hydroxylase